MPKTFKLFRLGDHKVRGFFDDDGSPWIVAADLAGPLELSERRIERAVKDVPAAHKTRLSSTDIAGSDPNKKCGSLRTKRKGQGIGGGGARSLLAVSEPGLYRIVARARAATREGTFAFQFVEWLTSEVLPSLRKGGAYVVSRRARSIVQGFPGWAEARQSGKDARRSLTAAVADFVAYAKAQGSNNAGFYFKAFTTLAYRLALGIDKPPVGGRDALSTRELLRVETVEDFLAQFVDEEREAAVPYKQAFENVKHRAEAIFLRRAAA